MYNILYIIRYTQVHPFIEGDNKGVQLDESILVSGSNPYMLVKTATVYWNYNNVFSGLNNVVQ